MRKTKIICTIGPASDSPEMLEKLKYFEVTKKKNHAIVIITEKITDAAILAKKVSDATGFSGRATVLGHIQRGGSPVPFDRVLATKMGDKAAELIENDKGGLCVGILNNEIVGVPIEEALNTPKKSRRPLFEMFDRLV